MQNVQIAVSRIFVDFSYNVFGVCGKKFCIGNLANNSILTESYGKTGDNKYVGSLLSYSLL